MQVSEEVCSPLEDELLFCEECRLYFREACPHHGAPTFVSDTPVPENVPSRAVLSLPEGLVLQERGSGATSAGGTIGVWSSLPTLPPGWIFGPYEGEILLDKQDCTLYSWAIKENGSYFYIDATDESKSNWMRYVACASNEEEHNLTVFQYRGRIYYRVCQPIAAGTELLVWIGEEYARTLGLKLGEHFKYEFGEKELLMKLFQDLQVKPPLPSTTGTSNSSTSSNHHEHYSEIVSSIIQAQKASYQSVHPSSSAGSNAGTGTTGGTTSGTGFNFLDGTQNLVSLGRAQSRYWTFFGFQGDAYGRILDKTKIICKLCGVRLSYSGNTTNLRQHLIYKHRPEYNELVGSQSALPSSSKCSETSASPSSAGGTGGGSSRSEYASSVSGSARAVQSSSNTTVPIVRATQAIADFLVKDLLPLETVDGEGFLQMMAILEPSYKVPASSFLANSVLKDAYMQYRIKSADLIKGPVSGGTPRSCAISIDLWTHGTQDASSSRRQYVTLLAHFVDDAFDYHNLVLTSRPVLGNLSADLLQDIAGEWGIETPSYAVIGEGICHCHSVGLCTGRDSCTYVDSAITALNLAGWKSIPCAGAALQRCMETVLRRQDILRTLERSRELAERLLSSSEETQQQFFRGRDPFLRTQLKMLSREGAHWYDIYGLAQCLTDHRLLLSSLRGIGGQSSPLESQDWMVLKELGDVLKPLAVATSTLSKDRFSSLSLVKPVLTSLIYKHLAPSDADSDFTREVKKSLRDDLTQIYADPEVNQTLNLACALDPRFRGLDFLSQVDRVETFHLLKREASELAKSPRRSLGSLSVQNGKKEIFNGTDAPELGGHAPSAKKAKHTSGIEFLLGDLCSVRSSSVGSACQQAEQEIGSFQTSEASSLCQEPLNWWKVHHAQYPLLARAARKLLAVPATVVPGPWLFTEAGAAIYRKRAALSAEHVDMMVFLHGNYAGGVGSSDCNSNSGSSAI